MATFNKPGVYIQEVLSPNTPVATATGVSTAAFIGIADRGPVTGTAGSSVIGAPTLVTDWADFCAKFAFGSAVNAFDSTVTNTSANPNSVGTSANDLKYALYSFFQNGGTQAYVSRVLNKSADVAKANFVDNVGGTVTITADTNTVVTFATASANTITVTVSGSTGGTSAPFATAEVGRTVSFTSGVPTGFTTILASTNSFVITAKTDQQLTLAVGSVGTITSATSPAGAVTIVGAKKATTPGVIISSEDPGLWGNNIWVAVVPNASPNYFDIVVYYSTRIAGSTATADQLLDSEIVDRIPYLSLNSADARYAPNVISSSWINFTDNAPANSSSTRVPYFTSVWATNSTNATAGSNGSFQWNSNNTTQVVKAVRLGSTATTTSTLAGTAGTSGSTAPGLAADILPKFDAVAGQLIFNYPNAADSTTVNALLSYAATRGDSFVVVDPGSAPAVTQTTASAVSALDNYTSNLNYGAAYFPNLSILDPASNVVGTTKVIAPGGAVAAVYCTTDNNRGTFKSPAGTGALLTNAVPVTALASTDFDIVNGAQKNLNIIRPIPGSGTCIMGARTISSAYSDKYIAVRRALNYIEYNLRANTQFAIFEPNDQNLWNDVIAVVSGFLNDFWAAGGLAGATAAQAYYVKCDSTINTSQSISAGELRIEVGVALQRPAEFIVIKIGQINGSTTVTTSI